jgi:tetratricopeptide (TPR) repeat protein
MNTRAELGTLEASGLIQVATLDPELEYLFRHALVQDAAYSSLLKQDRRALHRLAADTLISLYPERKSELAAVIAMHLEQAGDDTRAAEHLVIAGEHALERFANREAIAFFDRALALIASGDATVDLRLRATIGQGKVGWSFTGSDRYVAQLESIIEEAGGRADPRLIADAYFWVAFIRRWRGELPDSSPALKHALDEAARIREALGDPSANAIPRAFMGVGLIFTGHLRDGTLETRQALDLLEGKADSLSTAMLHGFLALGYTRLGEFGEAERTLARSEHLSAKGDDIARLDSEIARVSLHLERGDFEAGVELGTRCAADAEALGATACGVAANVMLGSVRLQLEDVLGAKSPLERGLELAAVTSMPAMRTLGQAMAGSVRARLGEKPAGVAEWGEALAAARAMSDRYGEAVTLWNRGRSRSRQREPDYPAALVDLDAARALFESMEARPALARVLRDRAQPLRALGRKGEADEADESARALAKELGLRDFAGD